MADLSEIRDDDYEFDDGSDDYCPHCDNGEILESACVDDLCHGGEVPCMHGDWSALRCQFCGK